MTICYEAFDSYDLQSFSFVPEFMLLKIIRFITNKTSKFYDVEIKQTKKNSADFIFKKLKEYNREKDHIYQLATNYSELKSHHLIDILIIHVAIAANPEYFLIAGG